MRELFGYFIFTSLPVAPNLRPRILIESYIVRPTCSGSHSLAYYMLSLVEAALVVADDEVAREGVVLLLAHGGVGWKACCS